MVLKRYVKKILGRGERGCTSPHIFSLAQQKTNGKKTNQATSQIPESKNAQTSSLPQRCHSRRHYCCSPPLLQHAPSLLLSLVLPQHLPKRPSQSFPHAHQSDPGRTDEKYFVAATIVIVWLYIACLAQSLLRMYDSTWPLRSARRGICTARGRSAGLSP